MEHAPGSGRPERRQLIDRRARAAGIAHALLLAFAVLVTFAPWLRVGARRRTSYETIRSAVELELLHGATATLAETTWAFLPLAAVVAVAALFARRPLAAALLGGLVGIVQAAFAVVVLGSPRVADWGASAGLVVGVVAATTAVGVLVVNRGAGGLPGGDDGHAPNVG